MKKTLSSVVSIFFFFNIAFSQQEKNTADRVIEGGQLVVDIVNIFKKGDTTKKSNNEQASKKCNEKFVEVCFHNNGKSTILIILELKENDDDNHAELIIPPEGEECSYITTFGIYKYQVQANGQDGKKEDVRKGEVVIEPCLDISKRVGK